MDTIVQFLEVSKTFRVRKQQGWKSLFHSQYEKIHAIKDLSFELLPGEMYGLIGENGAGKSTTLKLMTGILHSETGGISVLGVDPFVNRKNLMYSVGIIFGQRSILKPVIPVRYSLDWLKGLYGIPDEIYAQRLEKLADRFDVVDLIDRPPRQLSLGQRRRCDLIAALLHDPELILLDEPEIGLDYRAKATFRELLTEYATENDLTVVISSHDLGSLEQYCTRYLILHQGELLFHGDMQALRKQFSPKTVIRLDIRGIIDQQLVNELSAGDLIHFQQHNDVVTLYVDQELDMDEIIGQCYRAFAVSGIEIQVNSLEQILLETGE